MNTQSDVGRIDEQRRHIYPDQFDNEAWLRIKSRLEDCDAVVAEMRGSYISLATPALQYITKAKMIEWADRLSPPEPAPAVVTSDGDAASTARVDGVTPDTTPYWAFPEGSRFYFNANPLDPDSLPVECGMDVHDVSGHKYWFHPIEPAPNSDVGIPMTEQKQIVEELARSLYSEWCDAQGIHSNRFPSWHELTEPKRNEWRAKAEPQPNTGNAQADQLIGRLMSSDPDFDDCIAAAAYIRKSVAPAEQSQAVAGTLPSIEDLHAMQIDLTGGRPSEDVIADLRRGNFTAPQPYPVAPADGEVVAYEVLDADGADMAIVRDPTQAAALSAPGRKCNPLVRKSYADALRAEVDRLTGCLRKANSQTEEYERRLYLAKDRAEKAEGDLAEIMAVLND